MPRIIPKQLIDFLEKKWGERPCQMCSKSAWTVQKTTYELNELNDGNKMIGSGTTIPVIPITCSNCGDTHLVNAFVSGSLSDNVSPEPDDIDNSDNEPAVVFFGEHIRQTIRIFKEYFRK